MSEAVEYESTVEGESLKKGGDKKPNPTWAPNEAPLSRWVLFFVLTVVLGLGVQIPFSTVTVFWKTSGDWYWLSETLMTLLAFSCSYAVTVWLCHKVLRTSVRDLILGVGGKADRGQCVRLAIAWAVGFLLTIVLDLLMGGGTEVALNPVGPVPVLVNLVICGALLWMQTTWEEISCRCAFIRATCGNKVRPTFKCIAWGVFATVIFMSGHLYNPEVTSQTAAGEIVMACLSYFVAGMGMYLADVVYGSCLPGCVIHWVNNFVLFTIWTQAGSAGESAGLFYIHTSSTGGSSLLGTVILYVPIFAVMAYDWHKGRAAGRIAAEA